MVLLKDRSKDQKKINVYLLKVNYFIESLASLYKYFITSQNQVRFM